MRNVKLAIFDMDGLMLDTEKLMLDSCMTIAKKNNYPLKKEDYLRTVGLNNRDTEAIYIECMGEDFPIEEFRTKVSEIYEAIVLDKGAPKKQGLEELLDFLEENNIQKVVATSTHRERAEKILLKSGILNRFSFIVCGDEIEKGKPEPDIFLEACRRAGVEPKDAVVLEDSQNGLLAASRAGIKCLLIPDLVEPRQDIIQLAYARLNNLLEAMNIEIK